MRKAPLIEGRVAYEAIHHFHGNDFGPDFERFLPSRAAEIHRPQNSGELKAAGREVVYENCVNPTVS
jgi:hypothetical protein